MEENMSENTQEQEDLDQLRQKLEGADATSAIDGEPEIETEEGGTEEKEEEKKASVKNEEKDWGKLTHRDGSYFPVESDERFEDVAEEFQDPALIALREKADANKRNQIAPKVSKGATVEYKEFDRVYALIVALLKKPDMQQFNLRIQEANAGAIVYQASYSNVWARISKHGKIFCYRTILEKKFEREGVVEPRAPAESAGEMGRI